MPKYEYLLNGVSVDEYCAIYEDESALIELTLKRLNATWRDRVEQVGGVNVLLQYDLDRSAIGIFIDRKGKAILALDHEGLTEEEDAIVGGLYKRLGEKLNRMRMPNGRWMRTPDEIQEELISTPPRKEVRDYVMRWDQI